MAIYSFITALNNLSVISVSGTQRRDYLHGQLTIATKEFDPTMARFAAHCDFKGKMFTAMLVSEFDDAFLLGVHKDSVAVSEAVLKKYAVFSKVSISISQSYHAVGVAGTDNIGHLQLLFPNLSGNHMDATHNEYGQVICFNDASLRYLCYLNDKGTKRLLEVSKIEQFSHCDTWDLLEIEAGIANIQTETISQFVPQMLNFQCLGAIDFNKGCYMGQEVVARTKFLGKNKRATFLLSHDHTSLEPIEASTTAPIKAGDTLEMQIGENWRRAGTVVRSWTSHSLSAGAAPSQGPIKVKLLAVLPNDIDTSVVIRLQNSNIRLAIEALPYEVKS